MILQKNVGIAKKCCQLVHLCYEKQHRDQTFAVNRVLLIGMGKVKRGVINIFLSISVVDAGC